MFFSSVSSLVDITSNTKIKFLKTNGIRSMHIIRFLWAKMKYASINTLAYSHTYTHTPAHITMRAIKTDNRHLQKRIHITFVALLPFYAEP